jgi:hypothetical protein
VRHSVEVEGFEKNVSSNLNNYHYSEMFKQSKFNSFTNKPSTAIGGSRKSGGNTGFLRQVEKKNKQEQLKNMAQMYKFERRDENNERNKGIDNARLIGMGMKLNIGGSRGTVGGRTEKDKQGIESNALKHKTSLQVESARAMREHRKHPFQQIKSIKKLTIKDLI